MDSGEGLDKLEAARILISLNGGHASVDQEMIEASDATSHVSVKIEDDGLSALRQPAVENDQGSQQSGANSQPPPPSTRATTAKLPMRIKVDWQDPLGRKLLSICGQFSLIEAICCYDDLALYLFTQFLSPKEMLKMYCISKRFNWIVTSHLTTYMLSSARRWAPLSPFGDTTKPTEPGTYSDTDITTLMPFHNFKYLCVEDPTGRKMTSSATSAPIQPLPKKKVNTHPTTLEGTSTTFTTQANIPSNASSAAANAAPSAPPPPPAEIDLKFESPPATQPTIKPKPSTSNGSQPCGTSPTPPQTNPSTLPTRHVPTFRYLFMLSHRSYTIHSILQAMHLHGHHLPPLTPSVLAKLWLTLDLPTTSLRCALFRNPRYWRTEDIRVLLIFCVKLDMLFSDPVDGKGETSLREMMLAQRHLTVLATVLRRQSCKNSLEMLRLYVRWKYKPRPEHAAYSIMGVPPQEIGALSKEYWGKRPGWEGVLLGADECAFREAVRRGVDVEKEIVEWVIWGYVDPVTLGDRRVQRGFGRGVDLGSAPW